jgi:hypothetical protein
MILKCFTVLSPLDGIRRNEPRMWLMRVWGRSVAVCQNAASWGLALGRRKLQQADG